MIFRFPRFEATKAPGLGVARSHAYQPVGFPVTPESNARSVGRLRSMPQRPAQLPESHHHGVLLPNPALALGLGRSNLAGMHMAHVATLALALCPFAPAQGPNLLSPSNWDLLGSTRPEDVTFTNSEIVGKKPSLQISQQVTLPAGVYQFEGQHDEKFGTGTWQLRPKGTQGGTLVRASTVLVDRLIVRADGQYMMQFTAVSTNPAFTEWRLAQPALRRAPGTDTNPGPSIKLSLRRVRSIQPFSLTLGGNGGIALFGFRKLRSPLMLPAFLGGFWLADPRVLINAQPRAAFLIGPTLVDANTVPIYLQAVRLTSTTKWVGPLATWPAPRYLR